MAFQLGLDLCRDEVPRPCWDYDPLCVSWELALP